MQVEDWLRTAAIKDRVAGFLRVARLLSVWLDTMWVVSYWGGAG
jgi:hypothetical protein